MAATTGKSVTDRESAKQLERAAYDAVYSAGAEFSSLEIRESFLGESEQEFQTRRRALVTGCEVLEIGCGCGENVLRSVSDGAKRIVGVDISEEGITKARLEAEKCGVSHVASFLAQDIESLPSDGALFDVILDHEVFSSIDVRAALPLLSGLLKPGGCLLGLECFGHNPLFNLNRRIGVYRGRRTAWAASHIFREEDLEFAKRYFSSVEVEYHHLFIFLAYPFRALLGERTSAPLVAACRRLDRKIRKNRFLGRWAFKVVFLLRK